MPDMFVKTSVWPVQAISAGTCAIAAYDQEFADRVLGLDGDEEFTIYMAPVGKVQ